MENPPVPQHNLAEDILAFQPQLRKRPVHVREDTEDKGDSEKGKTSSGASDLTVDIDGEEVPYVFESGLPLPEDPAIPFESIAQQISLRAMFFGLATGAVTAASNVYLGLKTGWAFGGAFFSIMVSFACIKAITPILPKALPAWVGVRPIGPKETVAIQSVAVACGSLSSLWMSGLPAVFQLGLLPPDPTQSFGKIIAFAMACSFFGASIAVPFRHFFILRQYKSTPFPYSIGISVFIKAMFDVDNGAKNAKSMMRWLAGAFTISCVQQIAAIYVPGIIGNWHFFYWIARWGAHSAIKGDNWGWMFSIQPAFLGSGIFAGMNASLSWFFGSILAWGVIGPALVSSGRAQGIPLADPSYSPNLDYVSYYSLSCKEPTSVHCSPRYNLLWPGVLIMIVASFTEVAVCYRALGSAVTAGVHSARNRIRQARGKEALDFGEGDVLPDIAPDNEQIRWWMWIFTTVVGLVLALTVLPTLFGVNIGLVFLGLTLAFVWALIGCIVTGTSTYTPLTPLAKASQIIIGSASRGMYPAYTDPTTGLNTKLLTVNLFSGMLSGGTGDMAVDIVGDFKTGHLNRAAPVAQYVAQLVGGVGASIIGAAMFVLFAKASPCILEIDPESCPYSVPSAASWRATAIAVTATNFPVPVTSGIIAIILSFCAFLTIVARETICPARYKQWVPNWNLIGLGFLLPSTYYGANMVIGAGTAILWQKYRPLKYQRVGAATAAGMISGEGIAGVIGAILILAGATKPGAISLVGCPATGC